MVVVQVVVSWHNHLCKVNVLCSRSPTVQMYPIKGLINNVKLCLPAKWWYRLDMKCFTTGMSHEYECSRSGPNAGIGVVITSLLKQLWFTVVVFFPAATQLQQVRYGTLLLSRCGRLARYGMETGSERFASLTTFQSSKLNRSKGTNAHHLISSPACYHRTLECGTQRSRQP